jgi:hypothetical protein
MTVSTIGNVAIDTNAVAVTHDAATMPLQSLAVSTAKNTPSTVTLDVFKPYRVTGTGKNAGSFVSRATMQGEIFRVLASLNKGDNVMLSLVAPGADATNPENYVTRLVQKHMSTPVQAGRVYGEISFVIPTANGGSVIRDIPVHYIVAISCTVARAKEYLY